MPKSPKPSSQTPRSAAQLVATARASISSTSRFEDQFWEQSLQQSLQRLLAAGQDTAIESALDELMVNEAEAADTLFEQVQNTSQSTLIEIDGDAWQVLLMSAPLAVWTRYQLPEVHLTAPLAQTLTTALQQTVLAPGTQVHLMPQLLSLDEMPRNFSQIYQWLQRLGALASGKRTPAPKPFEVTANPALLADTRHLVFAALTRAHAPLFRWQHDLQQNRDHCLNAWTEQSASTFATLLPGCQFDLLLPDAYHSSVQLSETHMRSVAIRSACQWLQETLTLKPGELRATLVAVGEREAQEYRIGFHRGRAQDVIYGTIWPLFDQAWQDADGLSMIDAGDEIAAVLKQNGVDHIKRIPGVFKPEACDDCDAPYFPNPAGELVHIELPEEAFDAPMHFH